MLKQVEVERQRKVNQKGMQMYTDCTFVLRVKYNETRTTLFRNIRIIINQNFESILIMS